MVLKIKLINGNMIPNIVSVGKQHKLRIGRCYSDLNSGPTVITHLQLLASPTS